MQNYNPRLMCWALFLQALNLEVRHGESRHNVLADMLSCCWICEYLCLLRSLIHNPWVRMYHTNCCCSVLLLCCSLCPLFLPLFCLSNQLNIIIISVGPLEKVLSDGAEALWHSCVVPKGSRVEVVPQSSSFPFLPQHV